MLEVTSGIIYWTKRICINAMGWFYWSIPLPWLLDTYQSFHFSNPSPSICFFFLYLEIQQEFHQFIFLSFFVQLVSLALYPFYISLMILLLIICLVFVVVILIHCVWFMDLYGKCWLVRKAKCWLLGKVLFDLEGKMGRKAKHILVRRVECKNVIFIMLWEGISFDVLGRHIFLCQSTLLVLP